MVSSVDSIDASELDMGQAPLPSLLFLINLVLDYSV